MSIDTAPTTITVDAVDVSLLRIQRDFLLNWYWGEGPTDRVGDTEWMPEEVEGLVNLLDSMLDLAEGFAAGV
jgi:hypothetical protein